jgi:hypothetical protein
VNKTLKSQPIDEGDYDYVYERPKLPRPVSGYVIYSQVALDLGQKYNLGSSRQTALNLRIADAIRKGDLRSYDVNTGLPCTNGESSVYVRPDDMQVWLEGSGYALKWSFSLPTATDLNRGRGTQKEWTDERIKKLIARREELKAQGVRGWAKQASKEFDISEGLARKIIREYNERTEKLEDTSKWKQKAVGVPR